MANGTVLTRVAGVFLGTLVLVGLLTSPAAAGDHFAFSYRSGPAYYRPHHYPYWGPRYVYAPPPRVVYAPPPPPVVYAPAPSYLAPGTVVAQPTSPVYQNAQGQYCREYQSTVTVNGAPQASYGTACQMPDGSWRIVN